MAVANYHDTYKCYPPPFIADADGKPMHSWRILLLPYLGRLDLYEQYRFDEPWDGPNNRKLADQMPSVYALHGCEKPGNVTTNYLRIVGDATASPVSRTLSANDISDGVASTLFVIENVYAGVHWMEPRDLSFDTMSFAVGAPNGISSWLEPPAAVDLAGMVQTIPIDTPADVLRGLLTIAGGETDAANFLNEISDGRKRPRRHGAPCGDFKLGLEGSGRKMDGGK